MENQQFSARLSTLLRWGATLVVAGMIGLLAYNLLTRPVPSEPLTQEEIDLTVEAAVAAALRTAQPAVTPDLTGTIEARLTATAQGTPPPPSATPSPVPSPTPEPGFVQVVERGVGDLFGAVLGVLGSLWGVVVGIWNFLAFGGILLQAVCCIVVPLLIVIGAINS